jgi:hypothetical protein
VPRGGRCLHPNCDSGPCKQLTDAELTPGPEDLAVAKQLIADGFEQVSAKYRRVARVPPDYPTAEDLIKPEMLHTPQGEELADWWRGHCRFQVPRSPDAEVRELTLKQFRAFQQLARRRIP